jgi:hypothetical protein
MLQRSVKTPTSKHNEAHLAGTQVGGPVLHSLNKPAVKSIELPVTVVVAAKATKQAEMIERTTKQPTKQPTKQHNEARPARKPVSKLDKTHPIPQTQPAAAAAAATAAPLPLPVPAPLVLQKPAARGAVARLARAKAAARAAAAATAIAAPLPLAIPRPASPVRPLPHPQPALKAGALPVGSQLGLQKLSVAWYYDELSTTPNLRDPPPALTTTMTIAGASVQTIHRAPSTPSNQDLVYCFHLCQSENRVSWATCWDNCVALFGAGNKKVILALVRFNIQDERLKAHGLGSQSKIMKTWPGKVLLVNLEVERQLYSQTLWWRDNNSVTFRATVDFIQPSTGSVAKAAAPVVIAAAPVAKAAAPVVIAAAPVAKAAPVGAPRKKAAFYWSDASQRQFMGPAPLALRLLLQQFEVKDYIGNPDPNRGNVPTGCEIVVQFFRAHAENRVEWRGLVYPHIEAIALAENQILVFVLVRNEAESRTNDAVSSVEIGWKQKWPNLTGVVQCYLNMSHTTGYWKTGNLQIQIPRICKKYSDVTGNSINPHTRIPFENFPFAIYSLAWLFLPSAESCRAAGPPPKLHQLFEGHMGMNVMDAGKIPRNFGLVFAFWKRSEGAASWANDIASITPEIEKLMGVGGNEFVIIGVVGLRHPNSTPSEWKGLHLKFGKRLLFVGLEYSSGGQFTAEMMTDFSDFMKNFNMEEEVLRVWRKQIAENKKKKKPEDQAQPHV